MTKRRRGIHLTPEERAALDRELKIGPNATEVAKRIGVSTDIAQGRARELGLVSRRRWPKAGIEVASNPPHAPTPMEKRDAAFWRAKFTAESKARLDAEHVAEELAGVRNQDIVIPDWMLSASGSRGKAVLGCLVSDVHMGEVISPDEVHGVNAYDPAICAARLKRYFEAACQVGARWTSDTQCEGVLVALAGDLISGDIHDELRMTNALTSHEQVRAVVQELSGGIALLRKAFGRVHVVGVPGNHGRTTPKPTAKLYARLSYDISACAMIHDRFKSDPAITFQYGAGTDQIVPVLGRTVLVTHGDKIGTKGGMGFAGPNLPIVRGGKKVFEQQASLGQLPDLLLMGHYHTTTNPGAILGNGSIPGYAEFANDIRAAVEPPQQWLFVIHSRWGLRERAPIQLEEPRIVKPRVTIPARMAAA